MNASRLEVETHIITTQKSNLNNLRKAVKAAGVEVESVVLSGYASAIAVLNNDEKELGAAVVDMGGNTSNIVIHSGHAIRYNDFLGVGSNHITNELSMALHTPLHTADNVKITYGSLYAPSNDLIELPVIGDETSTHEVSLEVVHNVIYARVEETLMIIAQSIEKSGLKDHMGAGVVLTGGFTKIEGLRELAVAILDNMPVRLAKPTDVGGLFDTLRDPSYSGAVGLIKYLSGDYTPYEIDVNRRMRHAGEEPVNTQAQYPIHEEAPKFEPSPSFSTPPAAAATPPPMKKKKAEAQKMVNIGSNKPVQNDQPNPISKFWNWAAQLLNRQGASMEPFSIEESTTLTGARIVAVGVGGGARNMIGYMLKEAVPGIELIIANTDAQSVGAKGLRQQDQRRESDQRVGCRMKPEVGKESALEL
jgi:cell division protein FtsA